MLYLPISRGWLLSRTAQLIYLVSAALALAFVATLIGVHTAMSAAGSSALTNTAASLVRALLYPEIAGSAVLWVGMWYFWFNFDRSHYLRKAIWFVFLFFFAPLGTVAYHFLVYRRCLSTLESSRA